MTKEKLKKTIVNDRKVLKILSLISGKEKPKCTCIKEKDYAIMGAFANCPIHSFHKLEEKPLSEKVLYPKEIMPSYQLALFTRKDVKEAVDRLKVYINVRRKQILRALRAHHIRDKTTSVLIKELRLLEEEFDKVFGKFEK